jgi:transposase
MLIAHRITLDPNNQQRTRFARVTARFARALSEGEAQHEARKLDSSSPSDVSLRKKLNSLKREQCPWMFDVTKCAAQEAIIDLGASFKAFFEKLAKYSRFKAKGVPDSFCAANEVGTFRCDGRRIKLPKVGWVRMREAIRFDGVLKRVTVSRSADRWFAAILVEAADPEQAAYPGGMVGVDLGAPESTDSLAKAPRASMTCDVPQAAAVPQPGPSPICMPGYRIFAKTLRTRLPRCWPGHISGSALKISTCAAWCGTAIFRAP